MGKFTWVSKDDKNRSDVQTVLEYMPSLEDLENFEDFEDLTLKKCNPFLLFRRHVTSALKIAGRIRNASKISPLAKEMWKNLDPERKKKYELLSKKLSSRIAWKNGGLIKNVIEQETPEATPSIANPESPFYRYSKDVWRKEDTKLF